MDRSVSPRYIDAKRRLRRAVITLVLALSLSTLVLTLTPQPAAARVNVRRDRRPDREVSVPYPRGSTQLPRRQLSGFATREQRPASALPAANSADRKQTSSNKNDEQTAVRDTNQRLTR